MTTALPAMRIGAGLAAAMGLGRFVYTPLLPVMTEQAGLSARAGAQIATSNYLGYLLGAALTMVLPRSGDSRALFRMCLVGLVACEAAMALVPVSGAAATLWWTIRLLAGFCSGVVFVHCSRSVGSDARLGWAYAGVGAGILLSGVLTAAGIAAGLHWAGLWVLSAVVTAVPVALAWHPSVTHRAGAETTSPAVATSVAGGTRQKAALIVSYLGEGAGYIIIGTFIVAAIAAQSVRPVGALAPGNLAWMVAGGAAVVAIPIWSTLRARFHEHTLLVAAFVLQIACAAIPVFWAGAAAALMSAGLFGATFVAIVQLTLALGQDLRMKNSAAVLVTVYSVGQILGPLVVSPVVSGLADGYRAAFLIATVILIVSAVCAALAAPRSAPR